jgi:DnaK suppressor protein
VKDHRAQELVAAERTRIEAALKELTGEIQAQGALARQQEGESDAGSELANEMVEQALIGTLRAELEAVARAEARIPAGTYGLSTESGIAIPDERLESEPLAERTVEEQRRLDAGAR